jgi:DNA invertase Pin-like site-specific DNA recombinase
MVKSKKKKFFAYLRVSTKKQKTDGTIQNQRKTLKDFLVWHPNIDVVEWFSDDGISAFKERPKFDEMMERVSEVQGVIIAKLSRIGRSVQQLEEIVRVFKSNEIAFVVVKDNVDTSTPQGRLFFHLLSSFMEYEASLIRERTQEGRVRAIENGVKFGRKAKITDDKNIKKLYVKNKLGCNSIAKVEGVSTSTVRRRLIKMGVELRELNNVVEK